MKTLLATIMLASSASLLAQGTFFAEVFRDARSAGNALPAFFPLPPGGQGVVDTAVSFLPQPLDPPSLSDQGNCVLSQMIRRPAEPLDRTHLPTLSPITVNPQTPADVMQPFVQGHPWLLSELDVVSSLTPSLVPEPSALALTGLSAGVLAVQVLWRKRRIKAHRVRIA